MDTGYRQLWASLRTGMTWGAAWAVAGGTITGVLALFDPNPGIESLPERIGMAIFAGIGWGIRFGIAGAVIGTMFSAAVRLTYMGRRLRDIHPARFALLGGIVGGVGVPLYLQMMNVLSGTGPIAWGLVTDDGIWAAVFGAAAAGGSILLARRADALAPGAEPGTLDGAADLDQLPVPELREESLRESTHITRR
jgi:MFS family permease